MAKGYYFITDSGLSKNGNMGDVRAAVDAGVSVVQYRSKHQEAEAMIEEARVLKGICQGKAAFIINDNIDVALSVDADGVHLGQGDISYETARKLLGKGKIIGVSVHGLDEAVAAEKKGADYLGVGPIFATTTKHDAGEPCGPGLVREIKARCKIPVVAIGDINLDNAKEVIDAGADAICAISAVVTKDDVKKEIQDFQDLFKQRKGEVCFKT